MPKSWPKSSPEKSFSLEPFVTRIPVERDISKDGICETSPSPIVSRPNFCIASFASSPWNITPIMVPPTRLISVIIIPAAASPFTYFVAPSIAP